MSRKGFVDKNLFGLKNKLTCFNAGKITKKNITVPSQACSSSEDCLDSLNTDHMAEKKIDKLSGVCDLIKKSSSYGGLPTQVLESAGNVEELKNEACSSFGSCSEFDKPPSRSVRQREEETLVGKEYLKALVERKKEFVHTRKDILKRLKLNLEKLPVDIEVYEKKVAESKKIQDKLAFLVDDINTIKEKEWDKNNFSLELAKATKKIENSRLELFTIQQKTDYLLEDDIPGLEDNHGSFIPELTSLSAGQIFKFGACFFFPLIVGLLLTGLLISVAMFISMGVL